MKLEVGKKMYATQEYILIKKENIETIAKNIACPEYFDTRMDCSFKYFQADTCKDNLPALWSSSF